MASLPVLLAGGGDASKVRKFHPTQEMSEIIHKRFQLQGSLTFRTRPKIKIYGKYDRVVLQGPPQIESGRHGHFVHNICLHRASHLVIADDLAISIQGQQRRRNRHRNDRRCSENLPTCAVHCAGLEAVAVPWLSVHSIGGHGR